VSEQTASPVRRPRLNPFAFPSETTLRFVLLVIFVLCGSFRLYGEFKESDPLAKECVSHALWQLSKVDMSIPTNVDRNAETVKRDLMPFLARCAALMRPELVWKVGGMCLVVLGAALFYYLYPIWKLRTARLEHVSSSGLLELRNELHDIAQKAHLPDQVFVWNPLATGLPVVFGRRDKYYVSLSGSFVSQYFYRDRAAFRAIILHELAHIDNGDVHKTYLTMSLCLAFFTTAVAPAFFISFWHLALLRWWEATSLVLNSVLWTGVITLSGLAVLRAREYYADVRASAWDRESQMVRVLAGLLAPVRKGWRGYFQFHPYPEQRRRVVEDPSRLFRLGFADAFGIGIAAWFIVGEVSSGAALFMPSDPWMMFVFLSSIKLVVPVVVFSFAIGAIGIGVWRTAFGSLLKGDPPSKGTGWLAVAFVTGTLPGLIISVADLVSQPFQEHPIPFSRWTLILLVQVLTDVGLLLPCLLIFRWLTQVVSAWFEVVLRSRSPRPILLASVGTTLILVVGVLALVSFVVMLTVLAAPWRQGDPTFVYGYAAFAGGPIVIASIAVWAFPLAALWWQKQVTPGPPAQWVFLDGAAPDVPTQPEVRVRGALVTGAIMGLLFLFLIELVYFKKYLPTGIGHGISSAFDWHAAISTQVFGHGSFTLTIPAVVSQALAAAIVAARRQRLCAVCGLFAASVAGFIIVAGHHLFFFISYEYQTSQQLLVAAIFMGLGSIAAIAAVIVAAWFADMARRVFARILDWRTSAGPLASADAPADFGSQKKQSGNLVRLLLAKGSFAALCVVVAIGITARVREEILAMQEVDASRASAERGDSDAQNKLAYMYARGRPVARDDAEAVFWWRKAAEQGNADAQQRLAYMFYMGLGVAQDDTLAVHWIRKAAEQGNADGEQGLGMMYALGRGVPNDDSLALQWFLKAAAQGHANAENAVGSFHALGRGTRQDDAVAVEWFRKAAGQGHADAQNNLGLLCAFGRGTPQDDAAAVEWFRKAADQGHVDAQNNLGSMYQQGRALPKNDVLALQWFLRAARKGHAGAQFNVGQMYEKGEGVAKDDQHAVQWFLKAAEKGLSQAKNRLEAMCSNGLRAACSQ
jgi:TPR repeat protein